MIYLLDRKKVLEVEVNSAHRLFIKYVKHVAETNIKHKEREKFFLLGG